MKMISTRRYSLGSIETEDGNGPSVEPGRKENRTTMRFTAYRRAKSLTPTSELDTLDTRK